MSTNYEIKNLSFNPRDLSRDELLTFLKLPNNATENDIITKIQYLLDGQNDPSIKNFLYLVLSLLTQEPQVMGNQVFQEEYLGNNPQNSTVLGPNITQIQTDNPSDSTYNVQVEQGQKNPRYIEKYVSYLIINSAMRPNPITTPSETFSVDVDFNNVLSMRLSSITITPSWYNFDDTFANTSFKIKGVNIGDLDKSYCLKIDAGYYDLKNPSSNNDLITAIHKAEIHFEGSPSQPVSDFLDFSWNEITNKISITNKFTETVSIIFYDPTEIYCDNSGCPLGPLPKLNYNLGYYLGFRGATLNMGGGGIIDDAFIFGQKGLSIPDFDENKLIFNIKTNDTVQAFAQVNLNKSINAILSVDDYNKNVFPNKINLITPRSNQLSLPSYYNKGIKCDVSGNLPDTRQTTVLTSNPRELTNAQLYTIQEILNQNSNSYYLEPFGGGGGSSNYLATFLLESQITYNKRFSREDNTQRVYTGTVRIGRLKLNLTTSNGIPLNLHQNDWEIVLEIEQHYQSLNN